MKSKTSVDYILNRICSIKNHPISRLHKKHRVIYLKGLGASLCCVANDNSSIVKLLFNIWAKCIDKENNTNYFVPNIKDIKRAITLQHKGLHFFYMKEILMLDCFNILKDSYPNITPYVIYEIVYKFFLTNVCGFFSKNALNKVYESFKSNDFTNLAIGNELLTFLCNNQANMQQSKKVLVVANVSAGKSTLINSLTGFYINRTKATACTDKLVYLENKMFDDGIMINNGTTYNYYDNINSVNSNTFSKAAFRFNSCLSSHKICFIDTPGINNAEVSSHRKITENAITEGTYDTIIYVSNCQYFGTNDEKTILEYLKKNSKKPIIFVLNQLDRFKPREDSIEKMLKDYFQFLTLIGFRSPNIIPISANAGLLLKQDTVSLDEEEAYEQEEYKKKFSKEFYILPRYVNKRYQSNNILDNTGIPMLEQTIIQTLQDKNTQ